MLANSTGKAVVKTAGDTWFFLTADYAFGHTLERDTGAVIEANGGKVFGRVRHPINTNDFSSFLLQAQASKAKVIGLANAGGDTINSIKQAANLASLREAKASRPSSLLPSTWQCSDCPWRKDWCSRRLGIGRLDERARYRTWPMRAFIRR